MRIYNKIKAAATKRPVEASGDKELTDKIDSIKRKEDRQKEKLSYDNDKRYVKVKLEELKDNPALATKEAVISLVKLAKKNRGLKQKIKKRFSQFFVDETATQTQSQNTPQPKTPREKKEKSQLVKRIDPLRKEEDRILKKVKKQKSMRQKKEDHDILDVAYY